MKVIYCDSVFDKRLVEPDYKEEMNVSLKLGFEVSLISFEELIDGNILTALKFIQKSKNQTIGIYRGWMLTPSQYILLYNGLLEKNIKLINKPQQYEHCHYLPNSYEKIKKLTPESYWTSELNMKSLLKLTNKFGNSPIIIKDYVKSEKHNWEDACFIPDASDEPKVTSVINKFLELRGEYLNKGIVFRKFEKLEFLTQHSKSKMPLTKEFRVFFLNKKIVCVLNYWDEGNYGSTKPNLEKFKKVATNIDSDFFTMDIAEKENGDWIIMELGDGQVAGLPENIDIENFYSKIFNLIAH